VSTSAPPTDQTLRCARHPSTETVLRCGRCDTPICPKCLVATPVGARCPTCAQVKRFGTLVKPPEIARSVAYGTATAAIGTLLLLSTPLAILGLLGYALIGFLVGETVSIGANRKRAPELGPTVIVCLVLGFILGLAVLSIQRAGFSAFSATLLIAQLTLILTQPLLLIGLGLGALLGWMRVR
jgi:hypothetical protein